MVPLGPGAALCSDRPRLPHSSVLLSEAAAPPGEEEEEEDSSPISQGLREAISSYLLLTDSADPEMGLGGKEEKSS